MVKRILEFTWNVASFMLVYLDFQSQRKRRFWNLNNYFKHCFCFFAHVGCVTLQGYITLEAPHQCTGPTLRISIHGFPIFISLNKDSFPSSNSMGSFNTYWKIWGFPGTHGTHANVDPAKTVSIQKFKRVKCKYLINCSAYTK